MMDEARDVVEAKNKTEITFFCSNSTFYDFFRIWSKKVFFARFELEKKISLITADFMPLKNIENHLQLLNLHSKLVDPRLEWSS